MKNIFLIIAFSLALTACGGGSGGGTKSVTDKDFFSLWKSVDDDTPLDLTSGGFNENLDFNSYLANGAQCNCDFIVIGDQKSGSYTLNSCNHVLGTGSGNEVPNCNALDHTGTYSKVGSKLTICDDTQDCTVYK
jgi:hypothetical protein